MGKAHAEDGVTGFQYGGIYGLVGLRAGVGLYVGIGGAEQFFHAFEGKLFGHIHVFAAAVVAFAGVAFGVFVGELAALGFHHGAADVVLGGNQLNVVLLALVFGGNGGGEVGIVFGDGDAAGKHI